MKTSRLSVAARAALALASVVSAPGAKPWVIPDIAGVWDGRSTPNRRAPGARKANMRAAVKRRNVKRRRAARRG